MKYFFLIFILFGCSSFSIGCAGFSKKLFENTSKAEEERLVLIEQKIQELEQALSILNTSEQNLAKRFEEISQKTATISTDQVNLYDTVNTLNSKFERKDITIESNLVKTQKNIDDLENKLNKLQEIEKIKTDLQNQIIVLLAQKSSITDTEVRKVRNELGEEVVDILSHKNEMSKNTSEEKRMEEPNRNLEKEELQHMMDEALSLYREGKYKESSLKWKEVLTIDPGNLEAKFNLDILEEKMKSSF
ncbi:MAG: hypothetical protein E3K32_07025 [wastewater metagenome]|nr:hypothetical protein [Candidatus Loosdrechtia aerotolerans]